MKNSIKTSIKKSHSILDLKKFELSKIQLQQVKGGDDIIITTDMVDV